MKNFIFTVDVESFTFETNNYDDKVIYRLENDAMPKLLSLLHKFEITATFFYTASYLKISKDSFYEVLNQGHEIASHGWDHSECYDKMSLKEQVDFLKKSKDAVEELANNKIYSFRAPFLRINSDTIKALEITGFKIDSSVASKRCDFMFTTGALQKLALLTAPSGSYIPSRDNPYKKGNSNILEVPVSSYIWSLTGTHLRISEYPTKLLVMYLINQKKINPQVFLLHPSELLAFTKKKTFRRGNIFQDNIRHWIKMKDLGDEAITKIESFIEAIKNDVKFNSIYNYYELQKSE
jgi:peptidoglycan/xylan/chitin deacetylase (PgdA/CDA1 family)